MTWAARDKFHPRPGATFLVLVTVSVFLALTFWQFTRGRDKEAAQALWCSRAAAPMVEMPAALADPELLDRRRVVAVGRYEADRQFLLDNRVFRGRAGYHVITPLHLAGSDLRVLVNRGWIAAGDERRVLPAAPVPAGQVRIGGIAVLPRPTFRLADAETGWEPVWQSVDLGRFRTLSGTTLQPLLIELAADSPDGFVLEWTPPAAGAARHYAYAAQWFLCALAALGLWLRRGLANADRWTPAP